MKRRELFFRLPSARMSRKIPRSITSLYLLADLLLAALVVDGVTSHHLPKTQDSGAGTAQGRKVGRDSVETDFVPLFSACRAQAAALIAAVA